MAFGAAAIAAPFESLAQQHSGVRRIGFLGARSRSTPSNPDPDYDAFVRGLRELGYVEGKNLMIEWRFADGKNERLPRLAEELVKSNVEIIVTHATPAAHALQKASGTIPIVFVNLVDPVGSGLVASLARPGGNITGLTSISIDTSPKQIELLKILIPALSRVAVLFNPDNSSHSLFLKSIRTAAQRLGISVLPASARTAQDIEHGFALMTRENAQAIIVGPDSFFVRQRAQIVELALKNRLPSIFRSREDVLAGVLMSYGPDRADIYRLGAVYVDKILRGAKPDELPIQQPTKIHLAINRKTVKALGLAIPNELLLRADEVFE